MKGLNCETFEERVKKEAVYFVVAELESEDVLNLDTLKLFENYEEANEYHNTFKNVRMIPIYPEQLGTAPKTVSVAVRVLIAELRKSKGEDGGLYRGWLANICMAVFDELEAKSGDMSSEAIGARVAEKFIDILIMDRGDNDDVAF